VAAFEGMGTPLLSCVDFTPHGCLQIDWQTAEGTDDVMRMIDCLERADLSWCAILRHRGESLGGGTHGYAGR